MNIFRSALTTLALVCLAMTAGAQPSGGMGANNPGIAFARIFGANSNFTATAELTMHRKGSHDMHSMVMGFAVREGEVRLEMDLANMKGGNMPPEAMARMKQMGMAHSITLVNAGHDKGTFMIYPAMKSYVEMPVAGNTGDDEKEMASVDKQKIGEATIDGHPCVKYRTTITRRGGGSAELITWEATDMDNFPIQAQISGDGSEMTVHFTKVDKSKPDASLFALPQDYKAYSSMQQMMMSNMGGMIGNMMRMHGGD